MCQLESKPSSTLRLTDRLSHLCPRSPVYAPEALVTSYSCFLPSHDTNNGRCWSVVAICKGNPGLHPRCLDLGRGIPRGACTQDRLTRCPSLTFPTDKRQQRHLSAKLRRASIAHSGRCTCFVHIYWRATNLAKRRLAGPWQRSSTLPVPQSHQARPR